MAKGSLFWGQGRGKLGQVVLSTVKGQQISRTYQATVANPKSTGQMEQRAKFANAVKFYKRSQQNLFKFAYEDKKKTESDYNAFMRHNVARSLFLKKETVANANFPALANVVSDTKTIWMLSQGSLPEILLSSGDSVTVPALMLNVPTSATADTVTIGNVSTAIIDSYPDLMDGDYITFVTIISSVSSINDNPEEAPIWGIVQLKLDKTDTTTVKDFFDELTEDQKRRPQLAVTEGVLSITAPSSPAYANTMFGVIASRNTEKGLLTSTSYLWANRNLALIIVAANTYNYRKSALESWNAKQAVLEGSIADSVG